MKKLFTFEVPGSPVPWERARYNRQTRTFFTSGATLKYLERVRLYARRAGVAVLEGWVQMGLHIYFPDAAVRDDDNVEKSIRDALQARPARRGRGKGRGVTARPAVAFHNDGQVRAVTRRWDVDRLNPRVVVHLAELELPGEPPPNFGARAKAAGRPVTSRGHHEDRSGRLLKPGRWEHLRLAAARPAPRRPTRASVEAVFAQYRDPEARCVKCGCTNSRACQGGCSWVDIGLCSRCESPRAKV